jgi:hypothetical protein
MVGTPRNTEKDSDGAPAANKLVARETNRSLVLRAFWTLAGPLCAVCLKASIFFGDTSSVIGRWCAFATSAGLAPGWFSAEPAHGLPSILSLSADLSGLRALYKCR